VALVCLLSLIISFIIASVIAIPFFGFEGFTSAMGSLTDVGSENIALLKFIQLVQSVGLFVLPSLLLAFLFGGSVTGYLKLGKRPYSLSILLVILIVFVANPFINFTAELNSKLSLPAGLSNIENWMRATEEAAAHITKLFLTPGSLVGLLFNIFLIAVIPAIGEEFLFRGIIQRIFKEWTKNNHLAVWISAILFSALHFQFYGFIPRAILGAMFGYLFIISGNLWLPIIAHFINNAAAVVAYHLYGEGLLNVDPEKIGVGTKYQIAAIISFALLIVMYRYFSKYEKDQKLIID
jgi:membrane protease YdiL (CAAX protease family)